MQSTVAALSLPPGRTVRVICLAGIYIALWVVLWFTARIADTSGFSLWFLPVGLRYFIYVLFGWPALLLELASTLTVSLLQWAAAPAAVAPSTWSDIGWLAYSWCASPLVYASIIFPMRRLLGPAIDFSSQRDLVYFFVSATAASLLGALVGVVHLRYSAGLKADDWWSVFGSWFTGDVIGIMTLSPFLLLRLSPVVSDFIDGTSRNRGSTSGASRLFNGDDVITFITMALAVLLIFEIQNWRQMPLRFPAITLFLMLPLIWLSFQYGLSAVVLAIALLDGMLVIAVAQLGQSDLVEQYQLVMILLSTVSLWLGGSVTARYKLSEQQKDVLASEVAQKTESLRRLNAALQQSNQQAIQANFEKSRFLTAASHDLRQPIHAVGMFVELLNHRTEDETSREILGKVNTAITEFQDLLDGLLDLARLDAKSAKLEIRDFPVSSLFNYMEQVFASQAALKGLKFKIHPSQVWLKSDSTLLRRVLLNLTTNALKYTNRGGILLACRPDSSGTHVRLEIWDTGIGIDTKEQDHIFKEFYQVGNASRNRHLGIGVGLSIVERSCSLLGIPLTLKSNLGQGTRVSMRVPLGQWTPRHRPQPDPHSPNPATTTTQNVLVIEDDLMSREALCGLLEQWGFQVFAKSSSEMAIDSVRKGLKVNLVLSDFHLPGRLNGVDAIRAIRADAGLVIPACVVTGNPDETTRQTVSNAGLVLLTKPVRPAQLRSVMQRLLSGDAASPD
jgi:signal transduction histidine kinase/ActR/RegA family two-component response regulator